MNKEKSSSSSNYALFSALNAFLYSYRNIIIPDIIKYKCCCRTISQRRWPTTNNVERNELDAFRIRNIKSSFLFNVSIEEKWKNEEKLHYSCYYYSVLYSASSYLFVRICLHLKCAYSMLREFVCRVLCYRVDAIYVVVWNAIVKKRVYVELSLLSSHHHRHIHVVVVVVFHPLLLYDFFYNIFVFNSSSYILCRKLIM